MALLLAAIGAFLFVRLEAALDRTIDQGLRERSRDVGALVRRGNAELAQPGEGFAQVLDPRGSVVESTPRLGRSLLTRRELSRATLGPIEIAQRAVPGSDEPARLLATPVRTPDGRVIVVVGASLEERGEALGSLLVALLVGGPVALVLASLGGFA